MIHFSDTSITCRLCEFLFIFVLVCSLIITLQRFLEVGKIKIVFIWSAKPSLNVWSSCYFLNIFTTDPLNFSHFYWLILDYYLLRKLPIQQFYWLILDYYLLRNYYLYYFKPKKFTSFGVEYVLENGKLVLFNTVFFEWDFPTVSKWWHNSMFWIVEICKYFFLCSVLF